MSHCWNYVVLNERNINFEHNMFFSWREVATIGDNTVHWKCYESIVASKKIIGKNHCMWTKTNWVQLIPIKSHILSNAKPQRQISLSLWNCSMWTQWVTSMLKPHQAKAKTMFFRFLLKWVQRPIEKRHCSASLSLSLSFSDVPFAFVFAWCVPRGTLTV